MDSKIGLNRTRIATSVSLKNRAGGKVDAFARGLIEVGDCIPENYSEYGLYRRYMHDILCYALVEEEHYSGSEFDIGVLGLSSVDPKLSKQKPDLYTVEGRVVYLGEVAVTYNSIRDHKRKSAKYKELISFLEGKGYDVKYNIFILELTDPEWRDTLPKISDLSALVLDEFIENLRHIHSQPEFQSLRTSDLGSYNFDNFAFKVTDKRLVDQTELATGVRAPPQYIKDCLECGDPEEADFEEYVKGLADGLLQSDWQDRPRPRPGPREPIELIKEWEEFKSIKPNTKKLPKILQLGCPTQMTEESVPPFEELCRRVSSLPSFGGYMDLIKASLDSTEKSDLDGHMLKLSLSDDELIHEQMSGPGRKALLKKLGVKATREAPTHIGVDQSHINEVESLIQQIESPSVGVEIDDPEWPSVETTGLAAHSTMIGSFHELMKSNFSGVLSFYQSLSREIVLNSMRRRKNRQYVLGHSGFRGVLFLIAPGAQLRTESNVEFVKIISIVSPITNPLSSPWHQVGDHWESSWLSVDTDRLKHWERCFDRVTLSSIGCSERLCKSGQDLIKSTMLEVKSGNFALLSLVFLEDKQSTSVTNQAIRYLWIKTLGDKSLGGVLSKFPSRISSCLQSLMIQRAVDWAITVSRRDLTDFIKLNKVSRDEETGNYDESTTGVVGLLPRLFTKGPYVPISYNLNEIYWCMAYNKDRQNPGQDSMNILKKILKEEGKYEKELSARLKESRKVDYFFGRTTLEQDICHSMLPANESHYFSMMAVRAGLFYQDNHKENLGQRTSWLTSEKLNEILGKNLSEFATFKASVSSVSRHVSPVSADDIKKVGSRTKAIELVSDLVTKESLLTACEVAMQFSEESGETFEIFIQIFKKGQVGGVREIIILYIKARIMINILEEISRLLSKSDKREILTKGRDKRLMMRGDYEELMSEFPKGSPVQMIKNSYDMATWCQKFIPTIFCSIFEHHFKKHPNLRDFSRFIFLSHSNKRIEYPRKLVELWCKHPEINHEDEGLQKAKENFFKTQDPTFLNHSNMCQGIPHYSSTVLALSCQSLRDKLFSTCLKKLHKTRSISWKTRVGSDDKGDMIALDMSKEDAYSQYLLFEQCALVSERLHSMELSVKSASGNVIYELNSAFMANLETLSPTIKFTMAGCDMIGTTSCTSFVNESYSRIRQMRENGLSSVTCGLAHVLNSRHFYDMFRTGSGMTNDPCKIMSQPRSNIPYDFGVYPYYDIDLQDIIGPELHNYRILSSSAGTEPHLKLLFTGISKSEATELFPAEEDQLLKKDHFGIGQGVIRQLSAMRERVGANPKEVEEFFVKNPFMLIRGPENLTETKMVIHSKLFTKGASEALRRTSPAIYIGRLAAFESAKAWRVHTKTGEELYNMDTDVFEEIQANIPCTYHEFLRLSLALAEERQVDYKGMLPIVFPNHKSLDVALQFVGKFGITSEVDRQFSQSVRKWAVNNFNYEFTAPLRSILETSFGLSQEAPREDVEEMKNALGLNMSSLESLTVECKERKIRPLDFFFYMSRIYKVSKTSKIQAFAYGPSTASLQNTAIAVKRFNHIPGITVDVDAGITRESFLESNTIDRQHDLLKLAFNLSLMSENSSLTSQGSPLESVKLDGQPLSECCLKILRNQKSVSGFDRTTQKIMRYLSAELMPKDELKEKLLAWRSLNYSYLTRQKKTYTQSGKVMWSGDLKVLVNSGPDCFTMNDVSGNRFLESDRIQDLHTFLLSLRTMCNLMGFEFRSFFKRAPTKVGEIYLSDTSKKLYLAESAGVVTNVLQLKIGPFQYRRLADLDSFTINKSFNEKSQTLTVSLSDRKGRTADICHFTGVYYPVIIPGNLHIPDNMNYLGIKLCRLFENKDWFFNGRLPSMSDSDSVKFLREDIDLVRISHLTDTTTAKVRDYMQVREEVVEENFAILTENQWSQSLNVVSSFVIPEGMTLEDLFAKEFSKNEDLGKGLGEFSWDDEFEDEHLANPQDESTLKYSEIESRLEDEEDGINLIRAIGYKKPKAKKNQGVISSLQQGSELKSRVLNMFFKYSSIQSESQRDLPGYIVWLMAQPESLAKNLLLPFMLTQLASTVSLSKESLREALSRKSPVLGKPLHRLQMYLYGGSVDTGFDLYDDLVSEQGFESGSEF